MARSSERGESDLLLSIQRQILNFSGLSDGDPLQSLNLPSPDVYTDGLVGLKHKCEDELRQLEHEVSQLEAEEAKASMNRAEKLKALNDVENILPGSEVAEDELEADISQLENEIDLLVKITGLRITETTYKVTNVGDNFLQKHHKLDGSCHDMGFKMRFDVEETWEETGEVTANLSNIKFKAPDEDMDALLPVLQSYQFTARNLRTDFSQNATTCVRRRQLRLSAHGTTINLHTYFVHNSLTLMFRVLLAYAKWKSQTEALLLELTNSYPGVSERKEDLSLIIKPPRNPGCEWTFTFGCTFSDDAKLSPAADLAIKLPRAMVAADGEGIYQSAPSKFRLMQTNLGVTPATKALIQTLLQ